MWTARSRARKREERRHEISQWPRRARCRPAALVVAGFGIKSAKVLSAVVAVLGIVLTAFCSHAIGHWLAGRLAGLRFLLSSDHWHGGRRASGQGAE